MTAINPEDILETPWEFAPLCRRPKTRKPRLTPELIDFRARELKAISGFDWRHITDSDRREASRELLEAFHPQPKKRRADPIQAA